MVVSNSHPALGYIGEVKGPIPKSEIESPSTRGGTARNYNRPLKVSNAHQYAERRMMMWLHTSDAMHFASKQRLERTPSPGCKPSSRRRRISQRVLRTQKDKGMPCVCTRTATNGKCSMP
ncbi:hypothetical protein EVAR_57560_1 [Eumeta japonica]|uniref:Uncharacterized protein n=1 Tax=Eumeta variegata TaxID=151549 RepID=A0A4C2A584_EUMVA|nr:hypothetical protein EVAR_57560_1 [Eumeta japonica]